MMGIFNIIKRYSRNFLSDSSKNDEVNLKWWNHIVDLQTNNHSPGNNAKSSLSMAMCVWYLNTIHQHRLCKYITDILLMYEDYYVMLIENRNNSVKIEFKEDKLVYRTIETLKHPIEENGYKIPTVTKIYELPYGDAKTEKILIEDIKNIIKR